MIVADTSGPGLPCEERYVDDPCDLGTRLQLAVRAEDLYCTQVMEPFQEGANLAYYALACTYFSFYFLKALLIPFDLGFNAANHHHVMSCNVQRLITTVIPSRNYWR